MSTVLIKDVPVEYNLWIAPEVVVVDDTLGEDRSSRSGRSAYNVVFKPKSWACSSVGRALDLHSRGRRFEAGQVHQIC